MIYDKNGKEFAKQGIYMYENDCISYAEIDDFEHNITPLELNKLAIANTDGEVSVPYHM